MPAGSKKPSAAVKSKEELEKEYQGYVDDHPEIQSSLSELLTQIIISKPNNIYSFGRDYFSALFDKNIHDSYLPILVIAGPSGAGKGTLIKSLLAKYPDKFSLSVSHTTRNPREGEIDGTHYNFVSKEAFEAKLKEDYFLEHANVHGNFYGTSFEAASKICATGKICILEIDVQGIQKVLEKDFGKEGRKIVQVAPPDFDTLEQRLRSRGTENEAELQKRLENARKETEWLDNCEKVAAKVVNQDREAAAQELEALVKSYFSEVIQS